MSNSQWGSDILLILEFINIVSTFCYTFIELIILLYNFLETSFSQYKKHIIFLTSFTKFSDMLPVFVCTRGIVTPYNICLVVNILNLSPFVVFTGNTKALKVNSRLS